MKIPKNVQKSFNEINDYIIGLYNEGMMRQRTFISIHNHLADTYRGLDKVLENEQQN